MPVLEATLVVCSAPVSNTLRPAPHIPPAAWQRCQARLQGEGDSGVAALVEAKGLAQISDPAALEAIVDGVLAASPKQLALYRGGKTKLQGYFVGRVPPHLSFVASACLHFA